MDDVEKIQHVLTFQVFRQKNAKCIHTKSKLSKSFPPSHFCGFFVKPPFAYWKKKIPRLQDLAEHHQPRNRLDLIFQQQRLDDPGIPRVKNPVSVLRLLEEVKQTEFWELKLPFVDVFLMAEIELSPWTSNLNEYTFWQEIFCWRPETVSKNHMQLCFSDHPTTCVCIIFAQGIQRVCPQTEAVAKKGDWKMNACKKCNAVDSIQKCVCNTLHEGKKPLAFTFHDFHCSTSTLVPRASLPSPSFRPSDVVPGPRLLDQHGVANEELPHSRHVAHLAIIQRREGTGKSDTDG